MARWTASAKWAVGPALDGHRDMPLALRLSEGLGLSRGSLRAPRFSRTVHKDSPDGSLRWLPSATGDQTGMRLKEVIRSTKNIVDAGAWKNGKMPSSAFPLGKSAINVNVHYRWRCVVFDSLGVRFRALVAYRLDLQKYTAYLGRVDGKDMTVLARYEWHASEPGWHMHVPKTCDDRVQTPGRAGGCDLRLPRAFAAHRQHEFDVVDDATAFRRVVERFRLAQPSAAFELTGA